MRNLLTVCVALNIVLGIVTANLWRELRAERQVIADMRAQMPSSDAPVPESSQGQALQPTIEAKSAPDGPVEAPQPEPVVAAVQPTPSPAAVIVPATVNRPPPVLSEARVAGAMAQSDQTATARVMAWKDRLSLAGLTLTTAQLQALNAAAIAEMRRETEESLLLDSTSQPMDVGTMLRMREETVNRQNETNMRILTAITPQLSAEQGKALRAQFESGHAARMAALAAEREVVTNRTN